MRRRQMLWDFLMDEADLPDELMPGQSLVEITGDHRVLIEGHLGVKGYGREKIIAKVRFGEVHICGSCLELVYMSKERLAIHGEIVQVSLHRRC